MYALGGRQGMRLKEGARRFREIQAPPGLQVELTVFK